MYSILSWIVTGLIVGALARAVLPGRQSMSLIGTILLGVVGAFVGGLIVSLFTGGFNNANNTDWDFRTWLASIAGGVLVLWAYIALMTGDRRTTTV
ncbi:MAG: GlsB/YeaQ/YmgE family stress response membrane protein [Gemmataceae bacterium]|nr:GlsB/YeaQ/YmgE family stress response membrane protein [Gemmataceae bacterium]